MEDMSANMERFRQRQNLACAASDRVNAEQREQSVRKVASCTDKLFIADVKIAKRPYRCPDCGDECVYDVISVTPEQHMYRRSMCACEESACAKEEALKAREAHARRVAAARRGCRLDGKLAGMTLDNMQLVEGTEATLSAAREFVDVWSGLGKGLVIIGECGSGKTHIAAGVGNALVEKGARVEFWPVFDLLAEMRRAVGGRDVDDLCDRLSRVGLLILDDLGNERIGKDEQGNWAREQLLRIIYTRDVHERPVLVTTNFYASDLMGSLGGPIVSRLQGMCTWWEITAGDFRPRGNRDQPQRHRGHREKREGKLVTGHQ